MVNGEVRIAVIRPTDGAAGWPDDAAAGLYRASRLNVVDLRLSVLRMASFY
jgi:hypothetical protein